MKKNLYIIFNKFTYAKNNYQHLVVGCPDKKYDNSKLRGSYHYVE